MKSIVKKSLLAGALIAVACLFKPAEIQAQTTMLSTTSNGSLDTVTNTGIRIMAARFGGFRETITATVNLTKISGTLGGTMVPVASNDGVNFYDISQKTSDTVTVANAAGQGKNYSFIRGYSWYGVQWTGTGTMAGSINGKAIARKQTD